MLLKEEEQNRISHCQPLEALCKKEKGAFKNFANFTGKHLCLRLFSRKACNFIKRKLQHRYFPVKFAKYLKAPIFKNILQRLLLEGERSETSKGISKNIRDKKKNGSNKNQTIPFNLPAFRFLANIL